MSRMDAPIVALMSPYLPGQGSVSIALQPRVCPAQLAHPKIPGVVAWWQPGAGTRGVAGRAGWGLTWPGYCGVWPGRSSPTAGTPG